MATHVSQATSTDDQPIGGGVVVGVDARGRSVSALVWAVGEAERDRRPLTLVCARSADAGGRDTTGPHDLGTLARRLTLSGVETRDEVGDPVEVLLRVSAQADLLTVGCRAMRPARRMVVGSTSRAVARWSVVPVVVVPETWMQPSLATSPVVAGVPPVLHEDPDGPDPDHEVLDFAFARAAAMKVPLVVVSARPLAIVHDWPAEDEARVSSSHDDRLRERLDRWRDAYPQVEVVTRCVAGRADQALLDAAQVGQLVVVGRHHAATLAGHLGRTAGGVLHRSTRPVAVVPSGSRDHLLHDLAARRTPTETLWGPTF